MNQIIFYKHYSKRGSHSKFTIEVYTFIMNKLLMIVLILSSLSAVKKNYYALSTQELLFMMGFVSQTQSILLQLEIQKRFLYMTCKEKKEYNKNKKRIYDQNLSLQKTLAP